MTIFSSFSDNFPPHYHTILAINYASNLFTLSLPLSLFLSSLFPSHLPLFLTRTVLHVVFTAVGAGCDKTTE